MVIHSRDSRAFSSSPLSQLQVVVLRGGGGPCCSQAVFTSPASLAGETTLSQNHNYDESHHSFMASPLFLVIQREGETGIYSGCDLGSVRKQSKMQWDDERRGAAGGVFLIRVSIELVGYSSPNVALRAANEEQALIWSRAVVIGGPSFSSLGHYPALITLHSGQPRILRYFTQFPQSQCDY